MTAPIGLNIEMAEATLRGMESLRDELLTITSDGLSVLVSAEVWDWFKATFRSTTSARENVDLARRDLQQALTDVLIADAGLEISDVETALGLPIGDVPVADLLIAVRRADALSDTRAVINRGDDAEMYPYELDVIVTGLGGLNAADRAYVLSHLTDKENNRLFRNVSIGGAAPPVPMPALRTPWNEQSRAEFYELYQCLTTAEKSRLGSFSSYLRELARAERNTSGDPAATAALEALRTNEDFTLSTLEKRVALLAQSANYPVVESINDLGRLVAKEWFQAFDLADSQRTAKLIAFLAQYDGGNNEIRDNTLDFILNPNSTFALDWNAEKGNAGEAGVDVLSLGRHILDAGNERVLFSIPEGRSIGGTLFLITNALAHEVNHALNGTTVSISFDYFMGEYRAARVGYEAELGRPPNRDEIWWLINNYLTNTTGAYDYIRRAVDDPTQGPQIAEFLSQMMGANVSATNLAEEWAKLNPQLTSGSGATVTTPPPVPGDNGLNNTDNHG